MQVKRESGANILLYVNQLMIIVAQFAVLKVQLLSGFCLRLTLF